ncbi:gamma-glutamylcyclotransferase family protein [Pelagibaculum spongiae]|uniref:Gamma-glutamylcyclotransferase n=1 Tax=Pelagibaculum spongiae TaxID=2080658 RepID=A0A2V1H028_9GAMM|nr:gamma-glutamylcyclotransferase family protein [Pelagibaculum spongiae]PVZ67729.1 gamma-glutamylcyclotransferase [Pelagibaculum spongiae]
MKYFAYGSNMSQLRIRQRISAEQICSGKLIGYQLRFHKSGDDGSAKCDAFYTGKSDDIVFGVLYEIDNEAKKKLDKIEGLGAGYQQKQLYILDLQDDVHLAIGYVATSIVYSLKPYDWYLQHVLVGARQALLPAGYLEKLQNIDAVEDKNIERSHQEKSLYY